MTYIYIYIFIYLAQFFEHIKDNFFKTSRWDICCLVALPKYMQLCYRAILDVYEEIEQEMRKQGKVYFMKYAKKEVIIVSLIFFLFFIQLILSS